MYASWPDLKRGTKAFAQIPTKQLTIYAVNEVAQWSCGEDGFLEMVQIARRVTWVAVPVDRVLLQTSQRPNRHLGEGAGA